MQQLFIIVLFICIFFCGTITGFVVGKTEVRDLIAECEKSLPRNQTCKAVIQAVPNEVKP